MNDRELMQQALEALEYGLPYLQAAVPNPRNGVNADCTPDVNCIDRTRNAITALRARLAEPAQRVCCKDTDSDGLPMTLTCNPKCWRLAREERKDKALAVVLEQAEDEGLWFKAQTAPEAYLQQELRRLHAAVETSAQEERKEEPIYAYEWNTYTGIRPRARRAK